CGGAGVALIFSGSLLLGQLAGILSAMAATCFLLIIAVRTPFHPSGTAGPLSLVCAGLWVSGFFFAELPGASALLLALAPAAASHLTRSATTSLPTDRLRLSYLPSPHGYAKRSRQFFSDSSAYSRYISSSLCGSQRFMTFMAISPALEAMLEEVVRAPVEQVVVGGDVFPGPMPVKLPSGCSNSTSHSSSSSVMTN